MNTSLPWPDGAEVLPIAPLRPVLDRLASLVTVHEQDVAMVPGLAVTEEEVAADPPPALEQLVDELGGITLRDLPVLTLDENGTPGAVYGIGEDLALQLAAPDLPTYLGLFTDALEATLAELSSRGPAEDDTETARTDAAEQLMDAHLFAAILGMVEDVPEAELVAPAAGEANDALALADLRGAALGTRVDPMEVETDGDPLEMHLGWREHGLVLAVHGG